MNCKRCDQYQATVCVGCAGDYGEMQIKNEIALWLKSDVLKVLEVYSAKVNKESGADLTIAEVAAAALPLGTPAGSDF